MNWKRAIVLAYIAAHGPVRLRQISAALGLDLTTLGTIMGSLRAIQAVAVDPEQFITARRTPRQRMIDRAMTELKRQQQSVAQEGGFLHVMHVCDDLVGIDGDIDLGALVDAITAAH